MDDVKGYEMLIGISKHMISISIAIIAGIVAYIGSANGSATWITFATMAITAGGVAVVFSVLLQTAITSLFLKERKNKFLTPHVLYGFSWLAFVFSGLSGGVFILKNIS